MTPPSATPAETEALAAVAAAVTGEGTPEAARVTSAPNKDAARMLALAGPALSAMVAGCVLILANPRWLGLASWPDDVANARVQGIAAVAIALCAILAVVVFRLASGGLKRVEARAGPGAVIIETGDAG